jgi:4-hydroxy-2-oxoheptanedioate aldolase
MKINTIRRRLLAGRPVIGVCTAFGSVLLAEAYSNLGFDFVLLDHQHGLWDDQSGWLGFQAVSRGPAIPVARVVWNDFAAIGRLLDRGAMGVVVPMIESAEAARAAASAARYPPQGKRSFGPALARYHGADYDTWINGEVLLMVQIEAAQAVEHAEEILAVEGVDGCWVGPMDLGRTMGVDLGTAEGRQAHEQALGRVLEACRQTGKIPGIFGGDVATTRRRVEQGFLFVTVDDTAVIGAGVQAALQHVGQALR